jgi:hypothetical protein
VDPFMRIAVIPIIRNLYIGCLVLLLVGGRCGA